jgi:hypothetical protein
VFAIDPLSLLILSVTVLVAGLLSDSQGSPAPLVVRLGDPGLGFNPLLYLRSWLLIGSVFPGAE